MKKEFEFKLANEDDIKGILALTARVLKTPGCAWDEEYPAEENFRESLECEGLYVVNDGEKIIATCGIEPAVGVFAELDCWSKGHKKPCLGCRLCVDPEYQGQHLAEDVVRLSLDDAARRHGYDSIHFFASKTNGIANKLYSRMKFREVGETNWLEEDWICYEAEL